MTFRDAPLYLEWAPSDILSPNTKSQTEEQNNVVGEESVKKVILEQSVEGIPEEEIDPDRTEVRWSLLSLLFLLQFCFWFFVCHAKIITYQRVEKYLNFLNFAF